MRNKINIWVFLLNTCAQNPKLFFSLLTSLTPLNPYRLCRSLHLEQQQQSRPAAAAERVWQLQSPATEGVYIWWFGLNSKVCFFFALYL